MQRCSIHQGVLPLKKIADQKHRVVIKIFGELLHAVQFKKSRVFVTGVVARLVIRIQNMQFIPVHAKRQLCLLQIRPLFIQEPREYTSLQISACRQVSPLVFL